MHCSLIARILARQLVCHPSFSYTEKRRTYQTKRSSKISEESLQMKRLAIFNTYGWSMFKIWRDPEPKPTRKPNHELKKKPRNERTSIEKKGWELVIW